MNEYFAEFGYVGLLLISFLAASLFPISSEVAVGLMLATGYNPVLVVITATFGNYLGASLNFLVGKYGRKFFFSKWISVKPKTMKKAEGYYNKWGTPILLLSWLPVIGDPLTVVPGALRTRKGGKIPPALAGAFK